MPQPSRRSLILTACAGVAFGRGARADEAWPTRTVRVVVPFTPGGATDLLARLLVEGTGRALGQAVVVENRPGAGGVIGAAAVAAAAPDGYTLLLVDPGAVAISPHVPPGVPYDPLRDFAPVTQLVNSATAFVGRPNLPTRTLAEVIHHAKQAPGALSCGTVGQNSTTHLAQMLFERLAGVSLLHVPYQGAGPAMNDLLADRIDLAFVGAAGAAPHIREGRLIGLAVTTPVPASGLPDVPPMASVLPEYDAAGWFCILAPRGTPPAIIARLHVAFTTALRAPEVQRVLAVSALEPVGSSPEEFTARLRRDIER
ncbi:MAG: tripartite tricarboxylate transporter substrate-binding protein [Pseudomonadota bacterium]